MARLHGMAIENLDQESNDSKDSAGTKGVKSVFSTGKSKRHMSKLRVWDNVCSDFAALTLAEGDNKEFYL